MLSILCAYLTRKPLFRDLGDERGGIIEFKVGKVVRIAIICTPEYELDLAHSNEFF